MRYLWVLILSFVVMACGDKPQRYDRLSSGATVLVFGAGLTAGDGLDKEDAFPAVLSQLSGWNVINAGRSDERIDEKKLRIDQELNIHKPKVVLIELGGKALAQRQDPSYVKENIREIIHRVKAYDAIPILIAIPQFVRGNVKGGEMMDSPIYQELSKEEHINSISGIVFTIFSDKELKLDFLYLNKEGQAKLAVKIYDELQKMGL